jgi:hypothetical protein
MSERRDRLPSADDELWSLVDAHAAGTLTVAERDRLEARLHAEPEARLFYVAYMDVHAHLQWRMRGESVPAVDGSQPLTGQPGGPTRRFHALLYLVLAASLVLVVGLLATVLAQRKGSEEAESPDLPDAPAGSVAVLIDNHNTIWEADTALPTQTGSALPPGRLKLRAGVVEVAFHGGGEVWLEGPSDFEVRAPDRGFLHRGKLTAKVPDGAPALQVGMPGVVVTDLGGEYGLLRAETGVAEVHVFAGQVGADPTDGQGGPMPGIRLPENAAARVDVPRWTVTPVPLNKEAFLRLRPDIRVIDAAVRGGQFAGRNFGMAPQLMVKNSIPDYCWDTYLRFDLSGIPGRVNEARVRLVPVQLGQPFDNAAAVVADSQWGETTITWDTKPPSGPAFARWKVQPEEPVELDVTRFVQEALAGDKKLSLRIFAPEYQRGKSWVQYGSREGDAESRPQLLVTTVP